MERLESAWSLTSRGMLQNILLGPVLLRSLSLNGIKL